MSPRATTLGLLSLASAWLCLGVIFGLFRRNLKRARPSWKGLTTFGRLGRILVTVFGTALFLAPFLWVAWAIVAR